MKKEILIGICLLGYAESASAQDWESHAWDEMVNGLDRAVQEQADTQRRFEQQMDRYQQDQRAYDEQHRHHEVIEEMRKLREDVHQDLWWHRQSR